ncbi:hypothetical protein KDC22_32350 [Paenibacillus tritici]|uniref:hypothetical protein n=1 Tax=Paenibacillus tritici TaxID=1873425 RepID=UPI001BA984BA|nr:hypothetical protein [Paenibacillus tritici]QUL54874.1 hypothetical protein KDC22_32350 [Paenibacillus tritici]
MYHSTRKYAVAMLSLAVLSQSMAFGAYTAAAGPSAGTAASAAVPTLEGIGAVSLKNGVSVRLLDAALQPQEGGNILTYTLNYYNQSNSSVSLIDYFSRVTTSSGAVIQGKPVTSSAAIKSIPANSSQPVTYYVNAGQAAKLNGVRISLFGWDFSQANYQKKLGMFTIPGSYSTVIARGQSKKLVLGEMPVISKAESLQIIKTNGKVYARVGVSLSNSGTKVLKDTGLKGYLVSAGGSRFELNADKADYQIQPKEKRTLYYLADIPAYTKLDHMSLQFVREDSTLQLKLPVAEYKLPVAELPNFTVPVNAVAKLKVANHTIETQLASAAVYAEDNLAKWSLQFRVRNTGNQAVTIPDYPFSLTTAEGYSYPVSNKALAGLQLKPLEERTVELRAELPQKLNQGVLQLQMNEPAEENRMAFPAAYFQIPYSLQPDHLRATEYPVQNSLGSFVVKLESVERLPWSDQDQIVAKVSLRNTGAASVQLPALTALLKAGDMDISGTSQIIIDGSKSQLAPRETAVLYIAGKLPYSYDLTKLKMILQYASGEAKLNFLTLFTSQLDNTLRTVDAGEPFHLELTGKKAEVLERQTRIYPGIDSKLVYTELVMTNEELRRSQPAQLVGYYRTPDHQYFEAVITQSAAALNAKEKSLVTVWSKLPPEINASELTLYLGEGIAEGKLTAPGAVPTAYIETVGLALNPANPAPQPSLQKLELFPYSLSVNQVTATMTEERESIETQINYRLTRSESYVTGDNEHKFVVELVDPFGQPSEKLLSLGEEPAGAGAVGNLSFSRNHKAYKALTGVTVRVNVYDEFQGKRILLGSQSYPVAYERGAKKTEAE